MSEKTIIESRVSELQKLLSETEKELSSLKDSHQTVADQLTARESQIKAVSTLDTTANVRILPLMSGYCLDTSFKSKSLNTTWILVVYTLFMPGY